MRKILAGAVLAALLAATGCVTSAESSENYSLDRSKIETPATKSSDSIETKTTSAEGTTSETATPEGTNEGMSDQWIDASGRKPKDGEEVAVLNTNLGRIVLMFFPEEAPNHVKRFKECIEKKIYDGVKFHRVIPGFVIQGGDPNSKDDDRSNDGMGGYGSPLKAEFNKIKHMPGILSAARTNDPDSASSQFFICHGTPSSLDGKYTVYGLVVEGLDIVGKIVNLPRDANDNPKKENPAVIESAKLEKWPLK